MSTATLVINTTQTVSRRVDFAWPKPDTRIPEGQRPKPVVEGFVTCDYAYHSLEELERIDDLVEAGEMTAAERFAKLVPNIDGLPLEDGETAYQWLDRHKYGSVIRNAILEDYWLHTGEARKGNSRKRRSR